jgi:hypothetical protein
MICPLPLRACARRSKGVGDEHRAPPSSSGALRESASSSRVVTGAHDGQVRRPTRWNRLVRSRRNDSTPEIESMTIMNSADLLVKGSVDAYTNTE